MLKQILSASLIFLLVGCASGNKKVAMTPTPAPTTLPTEIIPLWSDGKIPETLGDDPVKDIPTLTIYRPQAALVTGAAMVICPGGGYGHLAGHEGRDYALWLNERGITCFVLKYRLGTNGYRHPAMMHDIQRAIRLVRYRAVEYKIDPARIGVMGSSAGGHLASTALTHFDSGYPDATDPVDHVSCRPDLGVLCYPVITMGEYTHQGSKENLFGKDAPEERFNWLSNELQVKEDTPPCFIWHNRTDKTVPVQNALMFADVLKESGIPYELHIYQTGGHGQGLGVKGYEPGVTTSNRLLPWTADLDYWLKINHFSK